MTWTERRQAIIDLIVPIFNKFDKSGWNGEQFEKMLMEMSESQFKKFAKMHRDGDWVLTIELPNLIDTIDIDVALDVAEELDIPIFQKLRMTDPATGVEYTTAFEYPVLRLPVRRTQQNIEHKMSLPEGDRRIDAMTGQVTGPDKSARVTIPESHILHNRGLTNTLEEFMQARGGNPQAWSEMRHQLEETGTADVSIADSGDRTRVARMTGTLMRAMHIDSNL